MRPTVNVSGGDRFQQRLRQLDEQVTRNAGVFVGVPKGAGRYEDGAPLAVIAAVHEFGRADGSIPERSFLRVPLRANTALFAQIIEHGIPEVISGTLSMRQLMDQVGARAAAISQEAISEGIPPPNAPSTVARKGSSTPLVDTGRLRQSITHVIDEGEEEQEP